MSALTTAIGGGRGVNTTGCRQRRRVERGSRPRCGPGLATWPGDPDEHHKLPRSRARRVGCPSLARHTAFNMQSSATYSAIVLPPIILPIIFAVPLPHPRPPHPPSPCPLRSHASIFTAAGPVFSPVFREMIGVGCFFNSASRAKAIHLAYSDIRRAFVHFLEHHSAPDRRDKATAKEPSTVCQAADGFIGLDDTAATLRARLVAARPALEAGAHLERWLGGPGHRPRGFPGRTVMDGLDGLDQHQFAACPLGHATVRSASFDVVQPASQRSTS